MSEVEASIRPEKEIPPITAHGMETQNSLRLIGQDCLSELIGGASLPLPPGSILLALDIPVRRFLTQIICEVKEGKMNNWKMNNWGQSPIIL